MTAVGKVYLVGAGAGDPGLLTLKGQECLQRADLVLYDGLVNPLLLRHSPAQAERTCRTPGPDGKVLKQDEINARLIEEARNGKTIVRLKGGDPFIFGRGSEEAKALATAGIPFEVVPGITAATAAGEYAGISLTHRDLSSAVAFVTGHEHTDKSETTIDYENLAAFAGTLVFYMGLHRIESIVASLISAGKNPETPACVISRATTPLQQTVSASLRELPQAVAVAGLHPPSLIVVGECVSQRESIAWFEKRPLFGKRIGITRPEQQAGPAISQALNLGAQPVLMPMIEIRPPQDWSAVDSALDRIGELDWILFTSANGVCGLLDRLWDQGGDMRKLGSAKIAVIGPSTANALGEYRLKPDLMPEIFRAEELADCLKPHVDGKRILWARASRGRDVLPRELEAAGGIVEQVVVYDNVDIECLADQIVQIIQSGQLDWVGLSSPSIARSFSKLAKNSGLNGSENLPKLASISPVTSKAADECGLKITTEANVYTWNGIFEAIVAAES